MCHRGLHKECDEQREKLLPERINTGHTSVTPWFCYRVPSHLIRATPAVSFLLKKAKSEKAKGLKLVGAGGTDNTDVGFYVVQDGNKMIVKNLRRSEKAEIFLPKTQNVSVTNSWNGDIHIDGFSGEVEANANLNGGLKMTNLSGPVTAYSLNQGIEVSFDKISQSAPIVIRTTNGEIDVTLPESTPADLELSSWNGDIYTNFDLQRPNKDGLKSISGKNIKGSVNGGGVNIKLKSTNGTIYLRKK